MSFPQAPPLSPDYNRRGQTFPQVPLPFPQVPLPFPQVPLPFPQAPLPFPQAPLPFPQASLPFPQVPPVIPDVRNRESISPSPRSQNLSFPIPPYHPTSPPSVTLCVGPRLTRPAPITPASPPPSFPKFVIGNPSVPPHTRREHALIHTRLIAVCMSAIPVIQTIIVILSVAKNLNPQNPHRKKQPLDDTARGPTPRPAHHVASPQKADQIFVLTPDRRIQRPGRRGKDTRFPLTPAGMTIG